MSFQEGVAAAMRDYAGRVDAAVVVDGAGSEDEVADRVLAAVLGGTPPKDTALGDTLLGGERE